jgi:hypothetical protein
MAVQPPSGFVYDRSNINVNHVLQQAGGLARRALTNIIALITGDTVILRQEVPFERWFRDHGYDAHITDSKLELNARGCAVLAALEGAVRTVAESIALFMASFISKNSTDADKHQSVLKAQTQGLQLSLMAILSPNDVKDHIKEKNTTSQEPIIGCRKSQLRWGTPYQGVTTIPRLSLECSQYPWHV